MGYQGHHACRIDCSNSEYEQTVVDEPDLFDRFCHVMDRSLSLWIVCHLMWGVFTQQWRQAGLTMAVLVCDVLLTSLNLYALYQNQTQEFPSLWNKLVLTVCIGWAMGCWICQQCHNSIFIDSFIAGFLVLGLTYLPVELCVLFFGPRVVS